MLQLINHTFLTFFVICRPKETNVFPCHFLLSFALFEVKLKMRDITTHGEFQAITKKLIQNSIDQ